MEKTKVIFAESLIPTVTDLMEKDGDYEEKEPIVIKINRYTNCGLKNRRRNTAKKNNKLRKKTQFSKEYCAPYYNEEKGYITYSKNSKAKKFLKKQTSKKARACNLRMEEDTPTAVYRNKLLDYGWSLM